MILKVFTVFDAKVGVFLPPMFCKTVGECARVMMQLCEDKNHQFYKFRDDFTLFELGTYDEELGQFSNLTAPVMVCSLREYCDVQS